MQLETLDCKRKKEEKFDLANIFSIQRIYLKKAICSGLYYEDMCVIILKYCKCHPE